MKNNLFCVDIDRATGCVTKIANPKDPHEMNWCSELTQWGKINVGSRIKSRHHDSLLKELELTDLVDTEERSTSVYQNDKYRITVERWFAANGNFKEKYTVKNISDTVVCINRYNLGIAVPFNDRYTFADDCMVNRCNTHIWCGGNSSWVNALKMGASDINLGLMLCEGSLESYSQYACATNVRGYFELEPETVLLSQDKEYTLAWELFWHTGKKDFFKKLSEFENYVGIEAEHFTVFDGESIRFNIFTHNAKTPTVLLGDEEIPVQKAEGHFSVCFAPKKTGEHKFLIKCGNTATHTEFMVKPPLKEFIKNRLHFIVDHQQCVDEKSPLYGAYLVYDNRIDSPYFDFFHSDHNACRERMNMPLALIKYLQHNSDEKLERSIDLYIKFLFREFYEETTGEVFNNIGKRRDMLRLYNAPGVMLIFTEMYYYTKQEKYLDSILMLAKKYYSIGGERCYSNAVTVKRTYNAFILAGRLDDAEQIKGFFKLHTDNMLKNGVSYPAHEVHYEQTIVTPAVGCISQYGCLSDNKELYVSHAKMHLECLDRFMGNQPSYHLNEISIRFWDDFWFGKSKQFGDTLPHHLSCLSARAFVSYAELTGEREYIARAENCIRNCTCLISDDARGSAAYVYPNHSNDRPGEFFDEWANDQDLIIYEALGLNEVYENTFGAKL